MYPNSPNVYACGSKIVSLQMQMLMQMHKIPEPPGTTFWGSHNFNNLQWSNQEEARIRNCNLLELLTQVFNNSKHE